MPSWMSKLRRHRCRDFIVDQFMGTVLPAYLATSYLESLHCTQPRFAEVVLHDIFRRHGSFGLAVEMGRWQNVRTAKIYVNVALMEVDTMSCLDMSVILIACNGGREGVYCAIDCLPGDFVFGLRA